MVLLQLPVVDDFFFFRCQVAKGHVCPDAHGAHDILHERPHQSSPDNYSSLIDGLGIIRHQGCLIHISDHPCPAAGRAGAAAVECKFFRSRTIKFFPAYGTGDFLHGCHRKRGRAVMAIGAAVACQPGKHKPETVQKFRKCPEGTADARNSRALAQRKSRRHISDIIHICPLRLCHPPAGIGRQGFQIPAGPFRIERAKSQ